MIIQSSNIIIERLVTCKQEQNFLKPGKVVSGKQVAIEITLFKFLHKHITGPGNSSGYCGFREGSNR
jgi:hypothetical protein